MRLWHYKLIPFLPDNQLKAQWRELNAIFLNEPKHILINYVYEYRKQVRTDENLKPVLKSLYQQLDHYQYKKD